MRIGQVFTKIRSTFLGVFLLLALLVPHGQAKAFCGSGALPPIIISEFSQLRDWLSTTFARQAVVPGMQQFSEQMSAVSMQAIFIVGTFLDAKHQLETQRLMQELQIEAQKDYQPSESFCALGTSVRSMAHSESVGRYNALAMAERQLKRHVGSLNMASSESQEEDQISRWETFTQVYCDPQDNNWTGADTGLEGVCQSEDSDRVNIDIDYTRLIENRRTIDLSYPLYVGAPDETDIKALSNNLYGHKTLNRVLSESTADDKDKDHRYMQLRTIAAKRSVAENSFNAIVGMKTLGSAGGILPDSSAGVDTYRYLGAVLTGLGIPEEEVKEYLGMDPNAPWVSNPPDYVPDPSYFAQLEILAKKIYQSPNFYANLYDTPVNIRRKSAALKAIELMLDRAIYESQLRQEMVMSVLLSTKLQQGFKAADGKL